MRLAAIEFPDAYSARLRPQNGMRRASRACLIALEIFGLGCGTGHTKDELRIASGRVRSFAINSALLSTEWRNRTITYHYLEIEFEKATEKIDAIRKQLASGQENPRANSIRDAAARLAALLQEAARYRFDPNKMKSIEAQLLAIADQAKGHE